MSSFGEDIRRERELRRITLREVAESTKITLRYLEALEKNEFDELPGGVFNRGFVRAYAEFIGVDPESMVTAYLLELQTRSSSGEEAPQDHTEQLLRGNRARGTRAVGIANSRDGLPAWSKWLLALIGLAILVLGGVYFVQRMSDAGNEAAPSARSDTPPSRKGAAVPVSTSGADAHPGEDTDSGSPAEIESATAKRVTAVIYVDRPTSGRVNCDNLQIETLDGARGGTQLQLECSRFLIIDATEAGALRLAIAGRPPRPLGTDGDSLVGYRVDLSSPGLSRAGADR